MLFLLWGLIILFMTFVKSLFSINCPFSIPIACVMLCIDVFQHLNIYII